jgi:hypothetical protein
MQVSTFTRIISGATAFFIVLTIISIVRRDVPWVITMTNIIVPVIMAGGVFGIGWFIYEMLRIAVTGRL